MEKQLTEVIRSKRFYLNKKREKQVLQPFISPVLPKINPTTHPMLSFSTFNFISIVNYGYLTKEIDFVFIL
jgi:hypothetical protein